MALISHQNKLIFIMQMRCGTHSVSAALSHCMYKYFLIKAHASAQELSDKGMIPVGYKMFTFVRNPFDRILSLYYCMKSGDLAIIYPVVKNMEFNDFIDWWVTQDITQYERCCIDGVFKMDFIGKFENIEKDFAVLCMKYRLGNIDLLKLNSSEHGRYTEYYDKSMIEKVKEKYEIDFKEFGYGK